jgi:hypothetical protein
VPHDCSSRSAFPRRGAGRSRVRRHRRPFDSRDPAKDGFAACLETVIAPAAPHRRNRPSCAETRRHRSPIPSR